MVTLQVSKTTDLNKLAGSIAINIRTHSRCKITAIGSQAINIALKGCIIARKFLRETHLDLYLQPRFFMTENKDTPITGIEIDIAKISFKDNETIFSEFPEK